MKWQVMVSDKISEHEAVSVDDAIESAFMLYGFEMGDGDEETAFVREMGDVKWSRYVVTLRTSLEKVLDTGEDVE